MTLYSFWAVNLHISMFFTFVNCQVIKTIAEIMSYGSKKPMVFNSKMRHRENRSSEKCLISYWFINLELFHPEW
jgi:hypothetical protein